jgi:hypothetical protein
MPDNSGLEKAVEEKLLRKLHKTYVRRMRPPIAFDADEFDQQREEVRRAIREDLAVIIPALLSTGELVERERLLSDEAVEALARQLFAWAGHSFAWGGNNEGVERRYLREARSQLEAALHTATQGKEGQ